MNLKSDKAEKKKSIGAEPATLRPIILHVEASE
jgi:hypothetical protein